MKTKSIKKIKVLPTVEVYASSHLNPFVNKGYIGDSGQVRRPNPNY